MNKRRTLTATELADAARLKAIYEDRKAQARSKGLKLTQDDVAEKCGWSGQSAFSQYALGRVPLNIVALLRLSKALSFLPEEVSPALASYLEQIHSGDSEASPSDSSPGSQVDLDLVSSRSRTSHSSTTGRTYSVPLISLAQAVSWVSGGYKMPEFEIEAYLPCAVPVGERAFAFRMLNDSMEGSRAEKPIHKGWSVFVDPDSKPELEQLALASIDGREPILGALTAHGGRLYIKPANTQYEKEEVDPRDPDWCLGRAVFVGYSL